MTGAIKPLSASHLGEIFALDDNDLKKVKTRAAECKRAATLVDVIAKSLPSIRQAVAAANNWHEHIYPELKNLCKDVSIFSDNLVEFFSRLGSEVKRLDDDNVDELPQQLKNQINFFIITSYSVTRGFSARFANLNGPITNFVKSNEALDNDIRKTKVATQFKQIAASLNALENASGHIRGGWEGLNYDFENIAKLDPEDFTFTVIADLQIDATINGWQNLTAQCNNFLKNNP